MKKRIQNGFIAPNSVENKVYFFYSNWLPKKLKRLLSQIKDADFFLFAAWYEQFYFFINTEIRKIIMDSQNGASP
jgi:hypothetical protein